ncbi:MAG: aminotransferase class I/II-fold pyridoxal phosphate-dependent enzyme [Rhodothermales bacterium]|nr:aminotransferase class I/II-fold pyridoxal phosphate-dependent enzyme [Rhodothermales bacterium]
MANNSLESVLNIVRPEVRREKAYHVGVPKNIEVKLNQNENPFPLPDALQKRFTEILGDLSVNRYPAEFPDKLIATIADVESFDPDGIIVGHGSNELSHFIALCFLGTETNVVLPRPMFALYKSVVRLFGAGLTEVPCKEDLSFDVGRLIDAIQRVKPALTVIASPNNPTGLVVGLSDIRRIVDASEGIVVLDEAYIEFVPEASAQMLLNEHPNLILLRTMSKAFGMAGLRIGYLVGHPSLVFEMKKARLPFMIGKHDELCAIELLKSSDLISQWILEMRNQTDWMWNRVDEIDGVKAYPTRANFFLFETQRDPAQLADSLGAMKIAVRKMSSYPELATMLRVCAGTRNENQRFVDALKRCI